MPVTETKDWLLNRIEGKLQGNYADIYNKYGESTTFDLKSKEDYWKDDSVKKMYYDNYGDKAEEVFNKSYLSVSEDYNNYSAHKYDMRLTTQPTVPYGQGYASSLPEDKGAYFTQDKVNRRWNGARELLGEMTVPTRDPRKFALDSKMAKDKEGNLHKVDTTSFFSQFEEGYTYLNLLNLGLVDFMPETTIDGKTDWEDKAGNKATGLAYDSSMAYSREDPYMKITTSGNFEDTAGDEVVSKFDLIGLTTPHLESTAMTALAAIPKSIVNGIATIAEGFNSLGASVAAAAGLKVAKEYFEDQTTKYAGLSFSKSVSAQKSVFDPEAATAMLTDVVVQLLSGKAIGTIAMKGAMLAGKALQAENVVSKAATAAKFASATAMTIYGGKDMYKQSKANHFTDREAGLLHLANLVALFGVNKLSSVVDDTFEAAKIMKINSELLGPELKKAYTATMQEVEENATKIAEKKVIQNIEHETLEDATEEVIDQTKNRLTPSMLKSFTERIGKSLKTAMDASKLSNKTLAGYTGAMKQEALEEMMEQVSEESVRQIGNIYVAMGLAGRDYKEQGEGRFMDIYDPGYWKQFGEGMLMSAAGGAIGGVVAHSNFGKDFFFSKQQKPEFKNALLGQILAGHGESYLVELDKLHKNGLVGDTQLSTTRNAENTAWVPMEQLKGDNTAISMNDANHQILVQEYNYLKSIVDNLNVVGGFENILKKNPLLADKIQNTSLAADVQQLTKDYIDLSKDNDNEAMKSIQPYKEGATDEEKEAIDKKNSSIANLDIETAKKIAIIKTKLDDIHSGRTVTKYYLQALAHGTIFNAKNPKVQETYSKYGDGFLNNILEATNISAKNSETNAEDIAIKIKENDGILKELDKKDLSNIDDILLRLKKDGKLYLSDKARVELSDLAKTVTVPQEKLNNILLNIKEAVKNNNIYSKENIENNEYIKKISNGDVELANKLKEFASTFYQAKLDATLANVHTLKDLDDVRIDSIDNIVNALADNDFSLHGAGLLISGDFMLTLKDKSTNAAELGKKIGTFLGENKSEEYESLIDAPTIDKIDKSVSSDINIIKDKFIKFNTLIKDSSELEEEDSYKYDSTNMGFLLNSFKGDEDAIEDGGSLLDATNDLVDQFNSSFLPSSGEFLFNNSEETQSLINQVKVRRAQIKVLQGIKGITVGLAEFKFRNDNIINNKGLSSVDIMRKEPTKEEINKFSYLLNKSFFNPIIKMKLEALNKKDPSLLTADEQKILNENNIISANLAYEDNTLKAIEAKLFELKGVADENSKSERIELKMLQLVEASVKNEVNLINSITLLDSIDKENPVIKEFINYFYNKFSVTKGDNESLIEDNKQCEKVREYLYNHPDKKIIMDEFNITLVTDSYRKDKLTKLATYLFYNTKSFYLNYKNILENDTRGTISTADQEQVSLTVAAHMNTNISNDILPYINKSIEDSNLKNTIFIAGGLGTGKSTYVLGLGAGIGQAQAANAYGSVSKVKILMSSNHPEQVTILNDTAVNYGLTTKKVGAKNGLVLSELIKILEGNKDINDVATIVYDESTYVKYLGDADDKSYKEKSDLAKISYLIDEINKKRDTENKNGAKLPPLKLILIGDPQQNGALDTETGVQRNISYVHYSEKVLTTVPLTMSHRSRVSALNGAIAKILPPTDRRYAGKYLTDSLNNIETNYGLIQGREDGLMGGVRFTSDADKEFYNNEDLYNNIKQQIELDPNFTVGVATTDDIPKDCLLYKMLNDSKYKNNFYVTTHELIQGKEFDYILATVNKKDIGNSKADFPGAPLLEEAAAKKLGTTIGRARYYSVVQNNTQRVFTSLPIDTIVIPKALDLIEVAKKIKELKVNMISGQSESLKSNAVAESTIQSTVPPVVPSDKTKKVKKTKTKKATLEEVDDNISKALSERSESAVKDSNRIYAEEAASNPSPTLTEEESTNINEVFENVLNQESAISKTIETPQSVMRKLEENGILAGYSNFTIGNLTNFQNYNKTIDAFYGIDNVKIRPTESEYKQLQREAMGLDTRPRTDFTYSMITFWETANTGELKIVATENSSGKKVIIGDIMTKYIIANNFVGNIFLNTIKEDLKESGNLKKKEYPVDTSIIDNISNGKITRAAKKSTLQDFRKKSLKDGLKISTKIFISTEKDSKHRGEAFLFYSFNSKYKFTPAEMRAMIKSKQQVFSPGYKYKGFKNGLGMIRLDSAPINFVELNDLLNKSFDDEIKYLENIININKGNDRMVQAFAELKYIFGMNISGITDSEVNGLAYASLGKLGKKGETREQFTEDQLRDVIETLRLRYNNDETGKTAITDFTSILFGITGDDSLGVPALDDNGEIKVFNSKRDQKYYPLRNDYANAESPGLAITHIEAGIIKQEEGKQYKDNNIFNSIIFLEIVNDQFKDITDDVERNKRIKNVLAVLDEVLSHSASYSKGMYLRPCRSSRGNDNKTFAMLDDAIDLEKYFLINVESIETPMLFLDIEKMTAFVKGKALAVVEPKVKYERNKKTGIIINDVNTKILHQIDIITSSQGMSKVDNIDELSDIVNIQREDAQTLRDIINSLEDQQDSARLLMAILDNKLQESDKEFNKNLNRISKLKTKTSSSKSIDQNQQINENGRDLMEKLSTQPDLDSAQYISNFYTNFIKVLPFITSMHDLNIMYEKSKEFLGSGLSDDANSALKKLHSSFMASLSEVSKRINNSTENIEHINSLLNKNINIDELPKLEVFNLNNSLTSKLIDYSIRKNSVNPVNIKEIDGVYKYTPETKQDSIEDIKRISKIVSDDSNNMNISDELSPEVNEIINSTWIGIEKLLSLPISSDDMYNNIYAALDNEINRAEAKFKELSSFIHDSDKREAKELEFFNIIQEAKNKVESMRESFTTLKDKFDLTIATDENLFPGFKIKDLEVNLSRAAKDLISNNLDDNYKNIWVKVVNGEDIDATRLVYKIKILSNFNEEISTEITNYIQKKIGDKNCS